MRSDKSAPDYLEYKGIHRHLAAHAVFNSLLIDLFYKNRTFGSSQCVLQVSRC